MGVVVASTSESILQIIRDSEMPVLASEEGTFKLTSQISDLVAKLTPHGERKLQVAQELVVEYVDISVVEQALFPDRYLHATGGLLSDHNGRRGLAGGYKQGKAYAGSCFTHSDLV